MEDKDSGEEVLSKVGITKTLTSAYDELSDLTDQLQDALDDTIKEAEKREVKLSSKSEDEYLPPQKKDEYIPPKKKDEYIPPKKKVKVKKERPYLPPTRRPETGYVSPSKHDTGHPGPPEVVSSYGLPPPPPGYADYLQSLQADHTIVTTYTVPPGSPLPDNHIIVTPEHLHFPPDSGYAEPLKDNDLYHEESEDVFIVDSYIPKEEVEEVYHEEHLEEHHHYEETTNAPTPAPVIDFLKYIPLFIVTTIAMAASIVFGNIIG